MAPQRGQLAAFVVAATAATAAMVCALPTARRLPARHRAGLTSRWRRQPLPLVLRRLGQPPTGLWARPAPPATGACIEMFEAPARRQDRALNSLCGAAYNGGDAPRMSVKSCVPISAVLRVPASFKRLPADRSGIFPGSPAYAQTPDCSQISRVTVPQT